MTTQIEITRTQLEGAGLRYEDRYGGYLEIFHDILKTIQEPDPVVVVGAPWSWVALIRYMGAEVQRPVSFFGVADQIAFSVLRQASSPHLLTRSVIETLCALRPETIDALWKVDRQWGLKAKGAPAPLKEFIITGNGSFDREEIQTYERHLASYTPTKRKVVLVPCAADKPYPAEIHKAVLALMPPDFYLANITGVLGIVPMDLWPVMPHYDSGIPNEWRCMNVVFKYFQKFPHERVICYCDFYNLAVDAAFRLLDRPIEFVNEVKFYSDYLNLLDPERLAALKAAFDRG